MTDFGAAFALATSMSLLVAQEVVPDALGSTWLDRGITVAAVGLLGYILLRVLRGDLVPRATLNEIIPIAVERAAKESMGDIVSAVIDELDKRNR